MSAITITDLSFTHEGAYTPVFEHASLTLDTDWRTGLVGRNGRGKTTLLRLLHSEYPHEGRIDCALPTAYFPYAVADPTRTVEAVLSAFAPEAAAWEVERELSLLQVDEAVLTRPFSSLSGGEQTKCLLAALFLQENRFLLIDEPTNHLDRTGRAQLAAYLKRKRGFLLVSHDRAFLDGCVDHILAINRTGFELQRGNFSSWWQHRQETDRREQAEEERLRRDIRRLTEAARQRADWSDKTERGKKGVTNAGSDVDRGYVGHKAAKMMKRAKAIERRQQTAIEQKTALLQDLETADPLWISPLAWHSERVLELTDVAVERGGRAVNAPLSLTLRRGERVALCGGNGCGKSSLLALIAGEPLAHSGQLLRSERLIVSYVPQHTDGLRGSLNDRIREQELDGDRLRILLSKLDFGSADFARPLEQLSSGQKKKVCIATALCRPAHLYVWDEPLNFVDVLSRMQIEELLCRQPATMLFTEHDAAFCDAVATRTLAVDKPLRA